MSTLFRDNVAYPLGETNNYIISGNIVRCFAIGEIGSHDDFFLIGVEPPDDSPYPLLSGNILDSNGDLLFRLERNVITYNPSNSSKIYGDAIGYEIIDTEGEQILKVETHFKEVYRVEGEYFYSTIEGNFYNKNKELIVTSHGGENGQFLATSTKLLFDTNAVRVNYSDDEITLIHCIYYHNGTIYQLLTGTHEGEEIDLDRKCLKDAVFLNCKISIAKGDFVGVDDNTVLSACSITFKDQALQLFEIFKGVEGS